MTDNTMTMARRTIYRSTAQKLTDGMREFLERQPFATLATHNPDGSIHVVSLSYLFEDGQFFLAAILTLIKDSGPYDPGKQTLEAYLRMLPTSRTRACSPSGHVRGRDKDRS